VDTLDYPLDGIIDFFNSLEKSLHQIFVNTTLHQEIFAIFYMGRSFN